jgi:peptide deformylase
MAIPEKRCDHEEALREIVRQYLRIVPANKIPKAEPLGNVSPSVLYNLFFHMDNLCGVMNGLGLHAVQVGVPFHAYIVRRSFKYPFEYFLNCKYEPMDGAEKVTSMEGCLSLCNLDGTSRYFRVERFSTIRVTGRRLVTEGKLRLEDVDMILGEKDGIYTAAQQHEIDHGSSILISDIGVEQHIFL